jgi:hypothetical protein
MEDNEDVEFAEIETNYEDLDYKILLSNMIEYLKCYYAEDNDKLVLYHPDINEGFRFGF